MKPTTLLLIVMAFVLSSCQNREREKALDAKEAELNNREQQLLLRQRTIDLKEQQLAERIRVADSTARADSAVVANDSALVSAPVNPALVGDWLVKMTCIETNCSGSAVGDVRVEQWNLSYTGNHLIAKASDHGKLIRTYSGLYKEGDIELIEHRDSSLVYDTRMLVQLRPINERSMQGQREIIMENECRILYSLTLDKIAKQ